MNEHQFLPHLDIGSSKDKTRILFVIPQLGIGGSERVVLDLTRRLNPANFESFVVSFNGGGLESSFRQSCKGVFVFKKKPGLDLSAMFKLAEIIKQNKIDIVNAHHYMSLFYSFLGTRISKSRLVYTEHSVKEVESVMSTIHGKIFSVMLAKIDAVVGVSKEIASKFQSFCPRYQNIVFPIPNAVDLERFRNCSSNKAEMRSKWGLSPNNFVVGVVANFRKVKNHVCLLRAACHLKNDFPDLRLLFAGIGHPSNAEDSESEILQMVKDEGLQSIVIFAGHQKDVSKILPVFDVFCLPSFSEGLPVSVLEAMAAEIPVIGSLAKGISEIIQDRHTGLLFNIDSDLELAGLIKDLNASTSLRQEIAYKGHKYVEDNHNIETWVDSYSRLFNVVMLKNIQ